jgi:hypothetical protein
MESVETNGNMQIVAKRWGVPITSLHNHIHVWDYTIMIKRGKIGVLQKEKKVVLVEYVGKCSQLSIQSH